MDDINKLQKVIVALDLSYMDDYLIKYVLFLKDSLKHFEHVILYHNIHFDYPEEAEKVVQSLERPLDELLSDKLMSKVKSLLSSLSFEIIIDNEDDTAVSLIKLQQQTKADLILFGKKVNYDGSGYLIERVLHQKISSNVLIFPETAFHYVERILVPVDFSKRSAKALSYGMQLAEMLDSEVICQYVYSVPRVYFPYVPVKDLKKEMVNSAEKKWKSYFDKYFKDSESLPGIVYSFHADKSISQLIFDHAISQQVSLLVLPLEVGFTHNTVVQLLKSGIHIPLFMVK